MAAQAGLQDGAGQWTLPEIAETFFKIERDLGLLDRQIAGVQYWPLLRAHIFAGLIPHLVSGSSAPSPHGAGRVRRVQKETWGLGGALMRPLAPAGTFDTVVMPSRLKRSNGGAKYDPFAERVLAEPRFGKMLILDESARADSYRSHANAAVGDRGHLRAKALAQGLLRVPLLLPSVYREFESVDTALRKELGYPMPVGLMQWALRVGYFLEGRRIFREVLRASRAKRFIVAGYQMNSGCVAAAKDLALETIEVQHGAITPFLLTHHYPGRPKIFMMADRFLSFGPFWEGHVDLPGNTTCTVIGTDRFAVTQAEQRPRPRAVLVSSHVPTDMALFDMASEAAALAPDWQFVFRPHPFEDFAQYARRLAKRDPRIPNMRLSQSNEDPYELLRNVQFHLGVFSTMLFEGMALGARTIVVALAGWEVMATPLEEGDAYLARTAADIVAGLERAPLPRSASRYFAQPVPSIAAALAQADHPSCDV